MREPCCLIFAMSRIGAGRLSGKKHRSCAIVVAEGLGERVDCCDPVAADRLLRRPAAID